MSVKGKCPVKQSTPHSKATLQAREEKGKEKCRLCLNQQRSTGSLDVAHQPHKRQGAALSQQRLVPLARAAAAGPDPWVPQPLLWVIQKMQGKTLTHSQFSVSHMGNRFLIQLPASHFGQCFDQEYPIRVILSTDSQDLALSPGCKRSCSAKLDTALGLSVCTVCMSSLQAKIFSQVLAEQTCTGHRYGNWFVCKPDSHLKYNP